MLARRTLLKVEYQGVDISDEVSKDILTFDYTDNASGESDSVNLSLKDEKHIWLNNWFPEKGDLILPVIETINWRKSGDKQQLPCGRFFVDEPGYDGRPSILTISAISSPLNSNFSGVDRSKNWRNISLKAIAGDIAKRAGLELQFIGNNNPLFKVKEQSETSDSAFLSQLCEEEGLAMKVTDSKIVIFDESEFEQRESITTYKESDDAVLSYSFRTSLANTSYDGVNVKYYDTEQGQYISFLFKVGETESEKEPKIYQLNKKVNNQEEARRLAQKTLRKLNKNETTVQLVVVGNVELLGGVCIDLAGFGVFDGKYYIQKATHALNGYTVSLEARKVLEGY